ncbi:MAG: hypothetical protein EXR77_02595 [Myxococcales bacterium]|nr:hypothetical protein [Myxococcales bacterium]
MISAAGCLNASTLQTARVLPPGDHQAVVGGGMTTFPGAPEGLGKALASLPYGEIAYRIGLLDGIDAGAHATLIGTGGGDVKWQLLDDGQLAVATGLGFGYLQANSDSKDSAAASTTSSTAGPTSTPSKSSAQKPTLIDVVVPVYGSYDVGSHLTVYAAAKYLLRALTGGGGGTVWHNVGGTGGIKLGDDWGLMIESTFMRNFTESFNVLQFNAAVYWSR